MHDLDEQIDLIALAQVQDWTIKKYGQLVPLRPWLASELALGGSVRWQINDGATRSHLHRKIDAIYDEWEAIRRARINGSNGNGR